MVDYLKYWRVIRYFIKQKYGLTQAELEMLLFLRSEKYFSKDDFDEFDELLSWNKNRFEKLRQEGWIEVFRKKEGKRRVVYQLSYKAQRMITTLYKKLEGEEIPESKSSNPLFLKNVSYTDKVYRNFILKLNQSIRQLQHLSQR
jgi:DNA-binding MarR family transcriptional regulator|tara:strand:+ start:513 stop:944 length:432 start_codon:yes stop_codon:yes gene_type:complete